MRWREPRAEVPIVPTRYDGGVRAILFFFALSLAMAQPQADQPVHASQQLGMRNVYFLPLPSGLEHFIANHLVKRGLLTVVTDPQLADAVFTDTLGKGFEKRLLELYPPPAPPKPEPKDDKDEDAKKDDDSGDAMDVKSAPQERFSSFGRGKGTIFLVDRKTNLVLWSAYVKPRSSAADDLNKAAKTIVDRIQDTIKGSSR